MAATRHTDATGSVRAISDGAGATTIRHDYGAFGEDSQPLTGDPLRFHGLELDSESALNYAQARYYRQNWGRFSSVDPLVVEAAMTDPQQWNRYESSRNGRTAPPGASNGTAKPRPDPPSGGTDPTAAPPDQTGGEDNRVGDKFPEVAISTTATSATIGASTDLSPG